MSSHLFAAALSSDDSDSDDSAPAKQVENRFVRAVSDSEDEKRVVRSAKDKRREEIQNVLRNLNNHKKIKDMTNVMVSFDELVKLYEKASKMNELETYPKFYVQCLAQLEDFVNESWEQKKSLNKGAAKSLTVLKQRIKKYNKEFEEKIKDYREHPELYEEESDKEDEDELESSDEGSEDEAKTTSAPKRVPAGAKDSDDDSSDDDFDVTDSSSTSDSDTDIAKFGNNPAAYFLRTESSDKKPKSDTKKTQKKRKDRPKVDAEEEDEDEGEWLSVDASGRAEPVVQAFEKGAEINAELVIKKITEILANRGKRTSSIGEQISLLEQVLAKIAELHLGPGISIKAMMSLITVLFDYESKHPAFMPIEKFKTALDTFQNMFEVLKDNQMDITVSDSVTDETESIASKPYFIQGSVLSAVRRLDAEYYKILQNANGHEVEYDERLQYEPIICVLLDKLVEYLE